MSKSVKHSLRGIYLRGNTYWYARQIAKKRHFVSLETSDLAEAINRVKELTHAQVLEPGIILSHSIKRYVRYRRERGEWSLSSELAKGYALNAFARWAGDPTPGGVIKTMIEKYCLLLHETEQNGNFQTQILSRASSGLTWTSSVSSRNM